MKTYTRPMSSWWTRNPYYLWYMLREASCAFITVYALILLAGLFRLYQGRQFFDAWRDSLSRPLSLAFHAVALVLVLYHSWTWFKVMPKTLPFIRIGATRVPDGLIVATGVAAAATASSILFVAVWWFGVWTAR